MVSLLSVLGTAGLLKGDLMCKGSQATSIIFKADWSLQLTLRSELCLASNLNKFKPEEQLHCNTTTMNQSQVCILDT